MNQKITLKSVSRFNQLIKLLTPETQKQFNSKTSESLGISLISSKFPIGFNIEPPIGSKYLGQILNS